MQQPPPTVTRILLRGIFRRCPRCGQGKLFRRWFDITPRCPRCGLRFEREEGAFLGSLVLNYGVTGAAFIALLIVWLIVDLPDVQVIPLALASLGVIVVVTLFVYPFAKTTWAAIDLVLNYEQIREPWDPPPP